MPVSKSWHSNYRLTFITIRIYWGGKDWTII